MVELSAGLMTLCLFLAWRVYVLSKRLLIADLMLRGIVSGKVKINRTEEGIELEMKRSING